MKNKFLKRIGIAVVSVALFGFALFGAYIRITYPSQFGTSPAPTETVSTVKKPAPTLVTPPGTAADMPDWHGWNQRKRI